MMGLWCCHLYICLFGLWFIVYFVTILLYDLEYCSYCVIFSSFLSGWVVMMKGGEGICSCCKLDVLYVVRKIKIVNHKEKES